MQLQFEVLIVLTTAESCWLLILLSTFTENVGGGGRDCYNGIVPVVLFTELFFLLPAFPNLLLHMQALVAFWPSSWHACLLQLAHVNEHSLELPSMALLNV